MKTILLISATVSIASCQEVKEQDYTIQAHVTDELGHPIKGAGVDAGKVEHVAGGPSWQGESKRMAAFFTDATGTARLAFKSLPQPGDNVSVFKPGYYGYAGTLNWELAGRSDGSNWQAGIKAVLRPVKNPIPMFANSMIGESRRYVRMPEIGKEYGYDLRLCEPLPPLGGGKNADFRFKMEGRYTAIDDYDLSLKVWFPNQGEGLVMFETPSRWSMHEPSYGGSKLQSEHEARPAGYVGTLERRIGMKPGLPRTTDCDEKRNFYFKCRSTRAPDGREVFNYGKIYGDFDFKGGNHEKGFLASFGWSCTYFNPTPDDRNVEFDPKNNLLQGRDKLTVGWP